MRWIAIVSFVSTLVVAQPECPITTVKILDGSGLNSHDMEVIAKATKRCGEIYSKSPCLVTFIKKDPLSFQVICGEKREIK
jgi:hypothetical protein